MKPSSRLNEFIVMGVFLGGLGVAFLLIFNSSKQVVRVDVRVPELSALALQGREGFDANCAQCHGKNASGSDKGPPLVHILYNPRHHGDQAFFIAAKRGVRRHHWQFGNMKPLPNISDTQLTAIVKYVRELQAANGIK